MRYYQLINQLILNDLVTQTGVLLNRWLANEACFIIMLYKPVSCFAFVLRQFMIKILSYMEIYL